MNRGEFDKKIQAEEVHDFQVMHKLFLVFALVYPLFGILDYIFYPEHLTEFLVMRFSYVSVPIACYLLSRKITNSIVICACDYRGRNYHVYVSSNF